MKGETDMTKFEFMNKHNLFLDCRQWSQLGSPVEKIGEWWLEYHNFTRQQIIDYQNHTYGWDDRLNKLKK